MRTPGKSEIDRPGALDAATEEIEVDWFRDRAQLESASNVISAYRSSLDDIQKELLNVRETWDPIAIAPIPTSGGAHRFFPSRRPSHTASADHLRSIRRKFAQLHGNDRRRVRCAGDRDPIPATRRAREVGGRGCPGFPAAQKGYKSSRQQSIVRSDPTRLLDHCYCVTVRVVLPLIAPEVAVMVAVPAATALASPVLLPTVATV